MVIPWTVIGWSLVIVAARIADVTLGTLRTVAVVNGRRRFALLLGFIEVLIWILVVSKVIGTINQSRLYPVAYAFGFALGTFIGITIEGWIGFGDQVIRVFSRRGLQIAAALRTQGHRVTEFDGRGRDGPVQMLFIETKRRVVPSMLKSVRSLDPECYYIVDDIRMASARRHTDAK
jgi:uncharacterized protein YebE (UPF0316 family)